MPLYRFRIESPWAGQEIVEEVFIEDDDPEDEELHAILEVVYENNFPSSIELVDEGGEDDEWE